MCIALRRVGDDLAVVRFEASGTRLANLDKPPAPVSWRSVVVMMNWRPADDSKALLTDLQTA